MNEIKHIHLGRTSFTISVEAQRTLQTYLHAIKTKAGKQGVEVGEEVEARMAELLIERGFDDKRVVLEADIQYLQKQLGEPSAFAEDAETTADSTAPENTGVERRLYRDTQNGWLGGVASGLANFTGLPVWFVRLAFIVLTFLWGASILIYILLWLLVPDAKTPSDRLRMYGKPVTVETLKDFVEKSGVSDNAREIGDKTTAAGTALGRIIGGVLKIIMAVIGVWLLLFSICAITGLLTGGSYLFFHPQGVFAGITLFPVGAAEKTLLVVGVTTLILLMLLVAVVGLSLVKRRWPLPVWLSVSLVVLLIAGSVVSSVGGATVAPGIRDRYNASRVVVERQVPSFKTIDADGFSNVEASFVQAANYRVTFIAYGAVNQNALKASVSGNELHISTDNYRHSADCQSLCIPFGQLQVIVGSPTGITPPFPKPMPVFVPGPMPPRMYYVPANGSW